MVNYTGADSGLKRMMDIMHQDTGGLPPEIRALLGVFTLYWQIDRHIGAEQLGRAGGHLVLRLDRPRRMGELARMMATVPSAVTAAAGQLEELGLVARVRDPQDRRAWLLQLTAAGRTRRAELLRQAGALLRQLSGLSGTELKEFGRLAGKIHGTIMEPGDVEPQRE
ncbi:MarR family winged helix-turn-helix transcriptional regulator [Roseobacteraceae bacterium NS-SX3]